MNETSEMFYDFINKPETEKLVEQLDKITDDCANGSVMAALMHTLILSHLGSLENEDGSIDHGVANRYLVELFQTLRVIQDDFFESEAA